MEVDPSADLEGMSGLGLGEAGEGQGDAGPPPFLPHEPIITIEEEEEVVLFWENGAKSKGQGGVGFSGIGHVQKERAC